MTTVPRIRIEVHEPKGLLRRIGRPGRTCFSAGYEADELDRACARCGTPVRAGDDNPWPELLARVTVRPHSLLHDKTSGMAAAFMAFGGTGMVNRGVDRDEAAILSRGQLWPDTDVVMTYGRVSNCHANAATLWSRRQHETVLATGYCLDEDGLWRQHSWCVDVTATPKVVETTDRRLLYFGYVMTADEAFAFHLANVGTRLTLWRTPTREMPHGPSPSP